MVNFAKDENENSKCQNFAWKRFIFDSLQRGRKSCFNILPVLRHRTEPIINKWGKTLGDPSFILRSTVDSEMFART